MSLFHNAAGGGTEVKSACPAAVNLTISVAMLLAN
jgi:hypothetical protein